MKTKFLFLFCILLTFKTLAQVEFAPVGAKWYYSTLEAPFYNLKLEGYILFESVKDTLLGGNNCKKISNTHKDYLGNIYNSSPQYMYGADRKVYYWEDGRFYLLYDFNLGAGDSCVVRLPKAFAFGAYDGGGSDTLLVVKIDSTKDTIVSNISLKRQFVHQTGGNGFYFSGEFIEGIGAVRFMFPVYEMWGDGGGAPNGLRCYSGSQFSYTTTTKPCDTIVTSVQKLAGNHSLVYTNPVQGRLEVESNGLFMEEINVFNLYGEPVWQRKGIKSHKMNTDLQIPSGLYLMQVNFFGGTTTNVKLLKE